MKVDLTQGSDEWHKWRSEGIGASDAAAIIGSSPWKTAYQLWLEKTGKVNKPSSNSYAMQRGIDMEEEARQWFNYRYNKEMVPECHECSTRHGYQFMRVSLDGICGNEILEIKCPGKKDHGLALQGIVPPKYVPQLQMQLMVSETDLAYYCSYDGTDGVVIEVKPDPEYQEYLTVSLHTFWNDLAMDIPPALTEKDYLLIDDDDKLKAMCIAWRAWDRSYKKAKAEKAFWKQKIIDRSDDGNFKAYGIVATRKKPQKKIDFYAILDELSNTFEIDHNYVLAAIENNTTEPDDCIGYWQIKGEKNVKD